MSDITSVLFGAQTSFIFRSQHDFFIFVGDCFVQGIIYGEIWGVKEKERGYLMGIESALFTREGMNSHFPVSFNRIQGGMREMRALIRGRILTYSPTSLDCPHDIK